MTEYKLSYTASEIDRKLKEICVSASSLGISADDAKRKNLSIIAEAINDGKKILMDLDSVVIYGSPVIIENDICIIADSNRRCAINVRTDEKVFYLTSDVKNIRLKNIDVVCEHDKNDLFFNDYATNGALQIDELAVIGCWFENICLYRQSGDRLYAGGELSKINKFSFLGNTVKNSQRTFCDMSDIMFNMVEICDNYVNNFYYILFNFGTSNVPTDATPEHQLTYDSMKAGKRKVFVDNNKVVNDPTWIQTTKSTLYHTFVLAECGIFMYSNNYVEGLKASIDIATYDFYAGAHTVISEGNVWKNNICFAADHDNCTLMKAKGGGGKKTFRNNRYIIEQDFVARLKSSYGATDESLWVDLISVADDAEWEVSENMIDLAVSLRLFPSSITAKKVDIMNNGMTAVRFTKAITGRSVDVVSYWRFENNVLVSTEAEYNETNWLYLIATARNVGGWTHIKNNVFNVPCTRCSVNLGTGTADYSYVVEGNKFIVAEIAYTTLANFRNNEFICKNNFADSSEKVEVDARYVISFSGSDIVPYRRIQVRVDTQESERDNIPIYMEIPEDRVIHCSLKLKHYADGVFSDGHIEIHTTANGSMTITDMKNGTLNYQGAIHPDNTISNDIYDGLLRKVICVSDDGPSVIKGGGKPGVLDVDFEVYQSKI